MTGLVRSTVSPSSSSMRRSTPWVDGCWGPMLMIMVSSSETSMSMSPASTVAPSGRRRTPSSNASSRGSLTSRRCCSSWSVSDVSCSRCGSLYTCVMTGSSPRSRRFLELHGHPPDRVVLAEGVALPVLRHQDAREIRMAGEDDAEHVVGLALEGVGAGPDVEQRRHLRIGIGHLAPEAHSPLVDDVEQVHHDLEPLGRHAGGQRTAWVREVVDDGQVDEELEALVSHLAHRLEVALPV